jgi:AcrR family transcriptional regulator
VSEEQALELLLAAGQERFDPYAERILEAAHAEVLQFGLRRTSLEDIARAAGVARATLFRRFPNRDALVLALAAREAQRSIAAVDQRVAAIEDPDEFLVTGALAVIHELTASELLARLLVTDTDQIVRLFTVEGGPILRMGRAYMAAHLRRLRDLGAPVLGDPDLIAELLARLVLSLALNRETVLPLDDDRALEAIVRSTIIPPILRTPKEPS